MDRLLRNIWATRFVFLETLWEEYLQDLVTELGHADARIFEPFCEQQFMADVVRDVLIDQICSVDEIKQEVAARFAAGITRKPWATQWKQLKRLEIGISESDSSKRWYSDLDQYFEIRNCIIHRQCRVSPLLQTKSEYYKSNVEKGLDTIDIWPNQIDYYRHAFRKRSVNPPRRKRRGHLRRAACAGT